MTRFVVYKHFTGTQYYNIMKIENVPKILTKIMKDGNIAVSDYDNKWISVHEPNGKFVSKVTFLS